MYRKIFGYLTLFGVTISSYPCLAQERDSLPTKIWSLEECLQYAQEHNILLNNLRLAKQSTEQDLISAKAAPLPDLNGSISQTASHTGNGGGSRTIGTSGSTGIISSITLFNGGILKNTIKQAQLNTASADLNVAEENNALYLDIISAYTNILLDKETIIYAQDLLQTSQAQTEQIRQQYQAGAVAKIDLIQMQAQLASDKYTLTNALNAEKQDKLVLKQLLQLPIGSAIDITKPDTSFTLTAIPTLQEVVQEAVAKRPEVKNSELAIQNAQFSLKNVKAGYLPVISLSGGVGTNYGNTYSNGFGNQIGDNFYQQLGITASIPIFTRKVNQTNVAKSNIAIKQAELDLLNTKTILSQEVEQAYLSTQNAYSQYDASSQQLTYNKEAYRISGEELKVGSANTVEYIQQKNLYIQALQAYTQAKYNAILYWNTFNFYRGNLLLDNIR